MPTWHCFRARFDSPGISMGLSGITCHPTRALYVSSGPLTPPALLPPLHLPRRPSGAPPPRTAPAPNRTAVTAATTTPRARGTTPPPRRRMATPPPAAPPPSPSERPPPARGCATPPPDAVPPALARATIPTREDSPLRNPSRTLARRARPPSSRRSPAARAPRWISRDWAPAPGFEPRPLRRTFASPIPQPRSSSWEAPARVWRRRIRF